MLAVHPSHFCLAKSPCQPRFSRIFSLMSCCCCCNQLCMKVIPPLASYSSWSLLSGLFSLENHYFCCNPAQANWRGPALYQTCTYTRKWTGESKYIMTFGTKTKSSFDWEVVLSCQGLRICTFHFIFCSIVASMAWDFFCLFYYLWVIIMFVYAAIGVRRFENGTLGSTAV